MESLMKINDPILLALIATGFTWFMTALGAAMVFFFKEINKRVLNMMLGFAAGIMVAASFWSLLAPAIEMAEKSSLPAWLVAAIGFLSGAAFLCLADRILPHAHFFAKEGEVEGIPTNWRRSILLVFSITLHNIPEGLAVGVAFGAAANSMSETGLLAAVAVALGIGIQNFPEGAAISLPLRQEGLSTAKSFVLGSLSGLVELIFGVLTVLIAGFIQPLMPWLLAFAAGAMLYVVVEELIPEAHLGESSNIGTLGVLSGFLIMMILDVALG